MYFHVKVCTRALALRCLGLLHHILVQKAALPSSQQASTTEGQRRKLQLRLPEGLVRKGGPHRCNDAVDGGCEVQPAHAPLAPLELPRSVL